MLTFLDCEAEEAKVLLYERARACPRYNDAVRALSKPVRHEGQTQFAARDVVIVFIRKLDKKKAPITRKVVVNASPLGRAELTRQNADVPSKLHKGFTNIC